MYHEISIEATLANVSNYTADLELKLESLELTLRTVIILAIHELLVNVVEHAYEGKQGKIDIQLTFEKRFKVIIRDYASSGFTIPENISEPDPLDLPENGMGLFIIYDTFDIVNYERLADGNKWHLERSLGDLNE